MRSIGNHHQSDISLHSSEIPLSYFTVCQNRTETDVIYTAGLFVHSHCGSMLKYMFSLVKQEPERVCVPANFNTDVRSCREFRDIYSSTAVN